MSAATGGRRGHQQAERLSLAPGWSLSLTRMDSGSGSEPESLAGARRRRGRGPGSESELRGPGSIVMFQCTVCKSLFDNFMHSKAHLRHSTNCKKRVTELAARRRKDTGIFETIDKIGIIEVKFHSRTNLVGGTGAVSREGRELLSEFQPAEVLAQVLISMPKCHIILYFILHQIISSYI
jgi:hypothetical protein